VYRYANCIPPYGIALLLESVIEYWIATCPEVRTQVYERTGVYDARYQRHPTDAARAGSSVSVKEHYFKQGMMKAKMQRTDARADSSHLTSELMRVAATSHQQASMVLSPKESIPVQHRGSASSGVGQRISGQNLAFAAIASGEAPTPAQWQMRNLERSSIVDPASAAFTAEKIKTTRMLAERAAPGHGQERFPLPSHLDGRSSAAAAGSTGGSAGPSGGPSHAIAEMPSMTSMGSSVFEGVSIELQQYDGAAAEQQWKQQLLAASQASAATASSKQRTAPAPAPARLGSIANPYAQDPHYRDPNYRPVSPYRTLMEAKSGKMKFSTEYNGARPSKTAKQRAEEAAAEAAEAHQRALRNGTLPMPQPVVSSSGGLIFHAPPVPGLPQAVAEPPRY
jgi:hypothetical protein